MRWIRLLLVGIFLFLGPVPTKAIDRPATLIGIDVSGSMRGEGLARTISAAQELIERTNDDRDIYLYTFARTVKLLNSKADLTAISSRGYTSLYDSILFLSNQARKSRASLIILTDGQDSTSELTIEKLLAVTDATVQIDFIAFQPLPEDLAVLQQIASKSGGKVINVDQVAELAPVLVETVESIPTTEHQSSKAVIVGISGATGVLALSLLEISRRWRKRERSLERWGALLEDYELKALDQSSPGISRSNVRSLWTKVVGDTSLILPNLASRTKRDFAFSGSVIVLIGFFVFIDFAPQIAIVMAILIAIVTLRYIVNRAERKLRSDFESELPGALKLIASSLTAGLSFLQSVDNFSSESNSPVSREFRRALAEIQMGAPVERALGDIAERMESPDLRWVVFAFSVQREVGGSLAKILQTSAETIESRANLRQEVRTLSAEGRISARILISLPPGIFLFLALTRPDFIELFWRESIGHLMLGVVILFTLLAWVWIRRLVRMKA